MIERDRDREKTYRVVNGKYVFLAQRDSLLRAASAVVEEGAHMRNAASCVDDGGGSWSGAGEGCCCCEKRGDEGELHFFWGTLGGSDR